MSKVRYYKNTDTVDIGNKQLGISNNRMLDNRGLHITIQHNGDKELIDEACVLQTLIVEFLNGLADSSEGDV
jgi:hypothetical protein